MIHHSISDRSKFSSILFGVMTQELTWVYCAGMIHVTFKSLVFLIVLYAYDNQFFFPILLLRLKRCYLLVVEA